MDQAAYIEAGLYDPAAADAPDRLALLEHLDERGFTIDEMAAADREGRLSILALERLLSDRVTGLTVTDAAARIGVSPELLERAQRAVGLPPGDGPVYDEESAGAFAAAAAFFGVDPALQFSRVMGSSVARIIDAAVSLFVTEVVVDSASSLEISQRSEDAVRMLLTLPATIEAIFPAYVSDAVRRLRLTTAPTMGGVPVAVGFVDLVGSTRLAQQLPGTELARAVGEFETAAYELALTHDSRVVKFIGDEAMFVSSEAEAACAIGVGLCEIVRAHPVLDRARGAVGFGDALSQNGDFYGPTVNLVSRLTGVAAPDQILGTAPLVEAATAASAPYDFTPAGAHALRGFAQPVDAFSVRRR